MKQLVEQQMCTPYRVLYSNVQGLRWMIEIAEALAYLHTATPLVGERVNKKKWIIECIEVSY